MPYARGSRLPAERASKLGHMEVIKNALVNELNANLKELDPGTAPEGTSWEALPAGGKPLRLVFAVDGSYQVIEGVKNRLARRAFVKTALLRLDMPQLAKIDKDSPHPLELRDLLKDTALHHATVFPLRHVVIPGMSVYDAVRMIIYRSFRNDAKLAGAPYETLKWLMYGKWDASENRGLPAFECPHCEFKQATLPFDADSGPCLACGKELYLTDVLGFHQDMAPDAAPDIIVSSYMIVHETMLLLTGVRIYWEQFVKGENKILPDCLFIKDGPLSIRAQYSKLVQPIRRFLAFAKSKGCDVHILGQEKSGTFFDHLQMLASHAAPGSYFVPGDAYIKTRIQCRPNQGAPYGKDTNYGAKVFVKQSNYHWMVANVPTGKSPDVLPDPKGSDLIGFDRIAATIPVLLSQRFEGALMPVELANSLASLSTYPSAQVLQLFASHA